MESHIRGNYISSVIILSCYRSVFPDISISFSKQKSDGKKMITTFIIPISFLLIPIPLVFLLEWYIQRSQRLDAVMRGARYTVNLMELVPCLVPLCSPGPSSWFLLIRQSPEYEDFVWCQSKYVTEGLDQQTHFSVKAVLNASLQRQKQTSEGCCILSSKSEFKNILQGLPILNF